MKVFLILDDVKLIVIVSSVQLFQALHSILNVHYCKLYVIHVVKNLFI